MSKTSSKRSRKSSSRTRGVVDRSASTDIVTQLEVAARNPHAAGIGALIGGIVPWFARTLAHAQLPAAWAAGHRGIATLMLAVVLGCAVFSALTVYKFGKAAFGDHRKALGFVLALEGVMLVSTGATSIAALVVLILINAVANGSVIALAKDATRKRCEADARRAATRRGNRVAAAPVVVPSARSAMKTPVVPSLALVTWRQPGVDDVADAEIVSEESFS